jgi:hypothetical protein
MLLDSALQLIDRCIQLLSVRQERRSRILADHVVPIYAGFEAVHRDYLKSFETYRAILAATDSFDADHLLFDAVVKDHVFTQDMRAKLDAMHEAIPKNTEAYIVDDFDLLMGGINSYFIWAQRRMFRELLWGNDPRSCLLSGLRFIATIDHASAGKVVGMVKKDPAVYFVDQFYLPLSDSVARWQHVLRQLENAGGRLVEIKRTLAIALIDSIVEGIQGSYGRVTERYLLLRRALSS